MPDSSGAVKENWDEKSVTYRGTKMNTHQK